MVALTRNGLSGNIETRTNVFARHSLKGIIAKVRVFGFNLVTLKVVFHSVKISARAENFA